MLVKSFIVTFLLLFIFLTDSSTSLRSARNDGDGQDNCQNEAVSVRLAPV